MKLLLCADLHLTDNPTEEYRWGFLEEVLPSLVATYDVEHVWILGDMWDRRDRHSAILVNRLISAVNKTKVPKHILMGNHDASLTGVHFWSFLEQAFGSYPEVQKLRYITKPEEFWYGLALPYSANPEKDWAGIDFTNHKLVFMHQTVEGALVEHNHQINADSAQKLPILPRGVGYYSGDVHRPQKVGQIVYVGTPYPVRFGEDWPGRVLVVDPKKPLDYQEVILPSIRRAIVDLNPANLESIKNGWKKGDQVRIRFSLSTSSLKGWPEDEARIKELLLGSGAELLSIETVLNEVRSDNKTVASPGFEQLDPEATLRLFAKEEKLTDDLIEVGLALIQKAV